MRLMLFAVIAVATPALAQETPASTEPISAQSAGDPPGGYAPPPVPRPPPGATVVFQPAPPPEVAFPPPAPLASYPPCRRGQFDKCAQRRDPK
jgi:hypothetical protein